MRLIEILQGLLDRHASRKNAMTYGAGPDCDCQDCGSVRKALRSVEYPGPEFCLYCGAGIGKFRRDGEGTCQKCDPEGAAEHAKSFKS
jgi:hypothetical protein